MDPTFPREVSINRETEKARLYEAIGYQENEVDPTFPREVSINREIKRKPGCTRL